MILLLSSESDVSTIDVIDWLNYSGAIWRRINGEDIDEHEASFSIEILSSSSSTENIKGLDFGLSEIKACWYRRFHNFKKAKNAIFNNATVTEGDTLSKLYFLLKAEVSKIHSYMLNQLDCFWLDHPSIQQINKLQVLETAKQAGLHIPDTIVTNCAREALRFSQHKKKVVTKHISEVEGFRLDNNLFMTYTSLAPVKSFSETDDSVIFPSLFQEYIEKAYEIRTFYLEEQLYSMAVFSQSNEQTKIDFRNYDHTKWNRMVPFQLPRDIQAKVVSLMKTLNLAHGSIDFIRGIDGKYYFLEVNPVGQFGMVSYPCNYFLEEKIAKTLIKHDQETYP